MIQIFYIITEVILYFSILGWILNEKFIDNLLCKAICGVLWIITIKLFENISYRETIFVFICIVFLFFYLCLIDRHIGKYVHLFSMIMTTITIYIIMSTLIAIPCAILYYSNQTWISTDIRNILLGVSRLLASGMLIIFGNKVPIYKILKSESIKYIITMIGIGLIGIYQTSLHLFDSDQKFVSLLVYNILIFVMIFGILWLIDHYRLSKGKLKAEQDSSRMNADLHRSKELMPLLLSVVNENQGLLDPQIVEEFQRIYAEQMIVGKRENMNYKLMGTTGITLLDSHLQHYIMECARKNIVMDVFVSEPIEDDMRELKIAQLQMHNIMGDMIRNAIRAIERENKTDGKILVIIGKKEAGMEIVVYDNGQMIPEMVLEKFGERGVTTGGTGNGLADLVDLLDMYDGSLVIEEKDASSSAYTKGIHLVFDGKCRRELYTVHTLPKKIYENGFWTKIKNVENG